MAAEARRNVEEVLAGMRDFDPYLRFSSPEDEREYREREGRRTAYIAGELAKGTPEGDLNATRAASEQMLDAKAHGADQHPDFDRRWNDLSVSQDRLEQVVNQRPANGEAQSEQAQASGRSELDLAMGALAAAGVSIDAPAGSVPLAKRSPEATIKLA